MTFTFDDVSSPARSFVTAGRLERLVSRIEELKAVRAALPSGDKIGDAKLGADIAKLTNERERLIAGLARRKR